LEAARSNELTRRRGAKVSEDLLDFTEFIQLRAIIGYHWEKFKPVLKSQKIFNVYMDRLGAFRNPTMHTRPLLEFETYLVRGIVGEIRNLVTLYRSEQGPDMNYYPEITQVTDTTHGITITQLMQTGIILRPGNTVTFKCVATDPQDRDLEWVMYTTSKGGHHIMRDQANGDEVTLTWNVEDHDVRLNAAVSIRVTSSGEYHRHGDWDQERLFHYRVDPPVESSS
jgi:hypothetical protein